MQECELKRPLVYLMFLKFDDRYMTCPFYSLLKLLVTSVCCLWDLPLFFSLSLSPVINLLYIFHYLICMVKTLRLFMPLGFILCINNFTLRFLHQTKLDLLAEENGKGSLRHRPKLFFFLVANLHD